VVEVCTDDLPEIAEEAGVVSIPTIKIYYGGELMDTIVGCVAKNVLGNAVEKILDDLGLLDDDNANANANANASEDGADDANASEDGADDANASEDGAEDGVVTTSGSVSGDKVEDEDEDEEEEDEAVDEDEDEDDHNSNDQQKKDD